MNRCMQQVLMRFAEIVCRCNLSHRVFYDVITQAYLSIDDKRISFEIMFSSFFIVLETTCH